MNELEKIKKDVLNCKKCPLYKERIKNNYFPVVGEGNPKADIMFIGEAPGLNEAKTGRPFCGSAGRILDDLLNSIRLKREDIYITNLIKDRPPKNRNPKPQEIKIYAPFLDRQIKAIKPKVICALGNFSSEYILNKYGLKKEIKGIGEIHGKVFKAENVIIVSLYHPAAAIYNPNLKAVLKKDFNILKNIVKK